MLRLTDTPAAWRGVELAGSDAWVHPCTEAEILELDAAVAAVRDRGLETEAVTAADFPLPGLAPTIREWGHELDAGRGFLLVRGLPVERWSEADAELAFWGIGAHLGSPVPQNNDGDLLGHVRDTGADPADPSVRLYRTRAAQPFHTDGSDVVALLCLATARSGGASTVASSVTVFVEMQRRRPDLVDLFFEPWPFDLYEQQAADTPGFIRVPHATVLGGRLFTTYLRFYIEQAQRHPEVGPLSARQVEFLDLVDALADEHRLDMDFAPGDIQLCSNAVILHGRAAYEDDPAQPRHLLRLWLALDRQVRDTR